LPKRSRASRSVVGRSRIAHRVEVVVGTLTSGAVIASIAECLIKSDDCEKPEERLSARYALEEAARTFLERIMTASSKVAFVNLIPYRSREGANDMHMHKHKRLESSRMVRAWACDILFPEWLASRCCLTAAMKATRRLRPDSRRGQIFNLVCSRPSQFCSALQGT
jgi:hypothetical protein